MKKATMISVAVMAAGLALSAQAKDQQPVGKLGGVQGNISIGGNGFVSKAGAGTPVVDGNTVLVSTNGRASVVFNNGCTVTLEGGQHFTVDSKQSCAVLQASAKQMFSPYRVAQVGGGGVGGGGAGAGIGTGIAITAGMAAGFALIENNDEVTSPR
ncbi:hypothetical protein [Piscinibacter sakaiensis]|uniref:hypothetical protein n=1 Tax=Piscinibacter sakaiensis TaxID=1547922 RepID=UPI003AABFE4C